VKLTEVKSIYWYSDRSCDPIVVEGDNRSMVVL